ncbi:hypothetical protein P22_1598 [Propionispora sp. 2/2-37]|uniref:serine hydrolase n=1 Tax=Propionispora sp. 2/2-37 TaxID=1677858 RepID=UPI0006BB95A9|nr:serine hydrolase [Propionispora sp. 2/2-37]CUH95527.1 hypothetical protein P22_1598 [Propionispora sp. 2/2-37]
MEALRKKIEQMTAPYTGNWGILVKNINTGESLSIEPDRVFPSASMIKLPIMFEVMRQAAAGALSLDDTLLVTAAARVGGAGILHELRPGIAMTIRELVTLMIIISDNTATNLLIDLVGMEAVNRTSTNLGLCSTFLRRHMMDFAAAKAGNENETTAADMALMLEAVYQGRGLPQGYADIMLGILKRQQVRDKLPFYLPEEFEIANKTGTLHGVEHDAGILYFPDGPYIVCVLTGNLTANYEGIQLAAGIGKAIYEHLVGM